MSKPSLDVCPGRRDSASPSPSASTIAAGRPPSSTGRRISAGPATAESGVALSIEARFREVLHGHPDLVPKRARVLVALSGGSDSTALLHLLLGLGEDFQILIAAAHFDHGLRAGSERVAGDVAERCRRAGIPCRIGTNDQPLRNQGEYRNARYGFLSEAAAWWGADRVVLAHHRDDQEETILLNLLRGTGLRGLAGIPPRRGVYVRPLLGIGREDLRNYLTERALGWVEDPSNEDPRYARARVRSTLLPRLRGMPNLETSLLQLGRDAGLAAAGAERRADRLWSAIRTERSQAQGGAQIARSGLLEYDRADQALILRKIARTLGFRLGRGGTKAAVDFASLGASGAGVDLGQGLRLVREYDRIRIERHRDRTPDRDLLIPEAGVGVEALELDGQTFSVRWGRVAVNDPWTATFSLHRLQFPLLVRAPRPGDRIQTRAGSRKLKKLLNERRVPRSARGQVPVLVGADRRVLWVVGHSIESSDPSTRNEEMFTIGVGQL